MRRRNCGDRVPNQSLMLMICTGQSSAASLVHSSSSADGIPSPMLPLLRNFSVIWLNESSGLSSKKSGQASQQDPQLTQVVRSMVTFTMRSILSRGYSPTGAIKMRFTPLPARGSCCRCPSQQRACLQTRPGSRQCGRLRGSAGTGTPACGARLRGCSSAPRPGSRRSHRR